MCLDIYSRFYAGLFLTVDQGRHSIKTPCIWCGWVGAAIENNTHYATKIIYSCLLEMSHTLDRYDMDYT